MIIRDTDEVRRSKRYLTVAEVADYLQLSMETVYMYARTGVIPATKIGKHWRFSLERIEEWMSRQEGESGVSGVAVLLVEPDLQISEAFKTWFAEAGCEVYAVASREQAFPLMAGRDFDLIMLDLMDPRLGGLDTLQQIRTTKPLAEIVVAASRFDADLMNRALDIGPLTVLRRPVAKEDVRRLAEAHRASAGHGGRTSDAAGRGSDRMQERDIHRRMETPIGPRDMAANRRENVQYTI
ncbi:MAG: helix-turn-helix domain-containing protein [Gemmatimonadales bacterium]|nr:MAG: helix-turn-helix domain-containing protein [Gemmatimonadales bacterium]